MKLLVTGGGTGGHVFPALSVAEEFVATYRGSKVVFVGAEGGMEEKIVPEKGFVLRTLKVKGIRGKVLKEKLKNLMLLSFVFPSCMRILSEEKPDAIIGFGGYASGPVVFSACLMNYITAIHEQNSVPGLTNRLLGRFVDRVFISFEESARYFDRKKLLESGMPVRKEILKSKSENKKHTGFTVLIIGGSQGARVLNKTMTRIVDEYDWIKNKVVLIHQTGKQDKEDVESRYRITGVDAQVYEFIDDIEKIYPRVDLVIARAGASTLAELSALGKPSILIPYPYAAGNHQVLNAKKFSDAGAAEVIFESELTPQLLAEKLKSIIDSTEKQRTMSLNAKRLFKGDPAKRIIESVVELIKERKKEVV